MIVHLWNQLVPLIDYSKSRKNTHDPFVTDTLTETLKQLCTTCMGYAIPGDQVIVAIIDYLMPANSGFESDTRVVRFTTKAISDGTVYFSAFELPMRVLTSDNPEREAQLYNLERHMFNAVQEMERARALLTKAQNWYNNAYAALIEFKGGNVDATTAEA